MNLNKRIEWLKVVYVVSMHYRVPPWELFKKTRKPEREIARQTALYLFRAVGYSVRETSTVTGVHFSNVSKNIKRVSAIKSVDHEYHDTLQVLHSSIILLGNGFGNLHNKPLINDPKTETIL